MSRGGSIRTLKDNFWCKKRVEANISVIELAGIMGVNYKTLGAYLTGAVMPNADVITAMCDWFGVDYIEGEREFLKAWKSYDSQRRGKKVKLTARRIPETNTVKPVDSEEKEEKMNSDEKMSEIAKLVYGKVPYDVFCNINNIAVDKLMETIYGKVDYITYVTIENILSDKIVKVESKWDI